MKYETSPTDTALRQSELLTNVIDSVIDPETIFRKTPSYLQKIHPFAVLISQDCDLDWDFAARQSQAQAHKLVPAVLLLEVMSAEDMARQILELEGVSSSRKSRIWARVRQNKDERYHFLEKIRNSYDLQREDIPELAIDFKRIFTVPTDELYFRIAKGETRRRCRLLSPYLEHLSSRFAYYHSRIALPEEHYSEPEIVRR